MENRLESARAGAGRKARVGGRRTDEKAVSPVHAAFGGGLQKPEIKNERAFA
jgi:hypothetical protein